MVKFIIETQRCIPYICNYPIDIFMVVENDSAIILGYARDYEHGYRLRNLTVPETKDANEAIKKAVNEAITNGEVKAPVIWGVGKEGWSGNTIPVFDDTSCQLVYGYAEISATSKAEIATYSLRRSTALIHGAPLPEGFMEMDADEFCLRIKIASHQRQLDDLLRRRNKSQTLATTGMR